MLRQLSMQSGGAVLGQGSFTGQAAATAGTRAARQNHRAPSMRSGGWRFLDVDSIETLCRDCPDLSLTLTVWRNSRGTIA
jgi:hypothetical protein